jgi:hypothetical protein
MQEMPQTRLPEKLRTYESDLQKAHPNQHQQAKRQKADCISIYPKERHHSW